MPSIALSLLAAAAAVGCGGAPPPAATEGAPLPVPPPVKRAAPPDRAPPGPPEPERLSTLAPPSAAPLCTIAGRVGEEGVDLATPSGSATFLHASAGLATLGVAASGAVFAEIVVGDLRVRGHVPPDDAQVRSRRWVSFGGVFFPGASAALALRGGRNGKLVVAAPGADGFAPLGANATTEIACADATLATDPDGVLARDLPAPFQPVGAPRAMFLKEGEPVLVSADPTGTPTGAFTPDDRTRPVTLLEQRGGHARVRRGHVAGWIDASLLVASKPSKKAPDTASFGMIGLLGGAEPDVVAGEVTSYVCPSDVRVVAEVGLRGAPDLPRWAVGAIAAGKPVRVAEKDKTGELATLVPDEASGLDVSSDARLAVPVRDLAACRVAGTAPAPVASVAATVPETRDAIDALDPDAASASRAKMWGGATGAPFGRGGLGLSGSGVGTAGAIGTLGSSTAGIGGGVAGPRLRQGATQVTGRLPPEVIQRIVRQNFGRFRLCYEAALRSKPRLAGKVVVRFGIDGTGAVTTVADAGSDVGDPAMITCVTRSFSNLSFPAPEGGTVTVVYPIHFEPGDPPKKPGAK